jgi:hypothetical protein
VVDLRTGFLSRMLATLYDLEVVEENGVRDWLSPPDNRHPFLKQAKDAFAVKDNVEAKKQVLLPIPPSPSLPFPSLPSLPSLPDSLPDSFPPSLPPSPLLSPPYFCILPESVQAAIKEVRMHHISPDCPPQRILVAMQTERERASERGGGGGEKETDRKRQKLYL